MKVLTTIIFFLFLLSPSFAQNNSFQPDNSNFKPGNLLPEVLVTSEIELQTLKDDEVADRADDFQKVEFKLYARNVEGAISQNEKNISVIKSELKKQRGRRAIELWHKLTSLEIENQQLKDDLWNYLHYGLGSWVEFREE